MLLVLLQGGAGVWLCWCWGCGVFVGVNNSNLLRIPLTTSLLLLCRRCSGLFWAFHAVRNYERGMCIWSKNLLICCWQLHFRNQMLCAHVAAGARRFGFCGY